MTQPPPENPHAPRYPDYPGEMPPSQPSPASQYPPTPQPGWQPGPLQSYPPQVAGQPAHSAPGPWVPAPTHPYRSPRALAVTAAVCAVIWATVELAQVPLAFAAQDDYQLAIDLGLPLDDMWTSWETMSMLGLLGSLGGFVTGSLWLFRARKNAEALRPMPRSLAAGWAWGGWVVPVVNLWFPFMMVRSAAFATDRTPGRAVLRGCWWSVWIAALLTLFGAMAFIPTDDTPDRELAGAIGPVETLNGALVLTSLVFWLLVLRSVTVDQETAARGVGTPAY